MEHLHDLFVYTRIKDGAFLSPILRRRMKEFEERDVRVEVILREQRLYANDPQRRFYFRVVVRTFAHVLRSRGAEEDDGTPLLDSSVHAMFENMFLKRTIPIEGSTGAYITKPGSTKRLTRSEMSDYITRCMVYCETEWFITWPEKPPPPTAKE